MNTTNEFRPRRQTMMNVKPTDYVPFENVVPTAVLQSGIQNTSQPIKI